MGLRGDAYDSAAMEGFFATLQTALLDRHTWRLEEELRTTIFFWLEVSCKQRWRHSTLGMLTPAEWETQYATRQAPA